MIIEYVPPGHSPAQPPSNEERWESVRELYRAERNAERYALEAAASAHIVTGEDYDYAN